MSGTNRAICAWHEWNDWCLAPLTFRTWRLFPVLYLVQFEVSVPGTTHPICTWYTTLPQT
ncbi:hypothetical protein HP456_09855 [Bacillus haikouensis]|uniref:hypothetical protein n=1 Tax=Bacillus haikouensis TaxID=1510468 RepID=UPI001557BEED|nr:hypothetical protein [Bacillus haikouensis]NQD66220.1 hypothetical protein [Bacillus haikouensis]